MVVDLLHVVSSRSVCVCYHSELPWYRLTRLPPSPSSSIVTYRFPHSLLPQSPPLLFLTFILRPFPPPPLPFHRLNDLTTLLLPSIWDLHSADVTPDPFNPLFRLLLSSSIALLSLLFHSLFFSPPFIFWHFPFSLPTLPLSFMVSSPSSHSLPSDIQPLFLTLLAHPSPYLNALSFPLIPFPFSCALLLFFPFCLLAYPIVHPRTLMHLPLPHFLSVMPFLLHILFFPIPFLLCPSPFPTSFPLNPPPPPQSSCLCVSPLPILPFPSCLFPPSSILPFPHTLLFKASHLPLFPI